jgi:asparagine synthetase B (glutamine-hydrolysing)
MTDTMTHRGPDGGEIWVGNGVGLGHRRLAIRDLSEAGKQPMSDPTGRITVTYNGEIYNERELRSELETKFGVVFRSHCDTEILPAGYLAWGEELFSRIEGIFAIGLWDAAERRLILARDPIGTKPLFYSSVSRVVRFASEIKGLLADPRPSPRKGCRRAAPVFCDGLSRAGEDHHEAYQANRARLDDELRAWNGNIAALLATAPRGRAQEPRGGSGGIRSLVRPGGRRSADQRCAGWDTAKRRDRQFAHRIYGGKKGKISALHRFVCRAQP